MEGSFIASIQKIEGSIENGRSVEVLLEIFSGQKVEQFVFLPGAADVSAENFAGVAELSCLREELAPPAALSRKLPKSWPCRSLVADFVITFTCPAEASPEESGSNDCSTPTCWMAPTGIFVVVAPTASSVMSIPSTMHPRGAAIAANDGGRRKSALGGRQHLAVELLHSGLKPGQIQELAVGGNLFHLRANDRAAHFRGFSVSTSLATGATTRCSLTSPVAVAAA